MASGITPNPLGHGYKPAGSFHGEVGVWKVEVWNLPWHTGLPQPDYTGWMPEREKAKGHSDLGLPSSYS